jgi:hypothetical protein
MNAYRIAWDLLKGKLEAKPSWGREEVKGEMKDSLLEAYQSQEGLEESSLMNEIEELRKGEQNDSKTKLVG